MVFKSAKKYLKKSVQNLADRRASTTVSSSQSRVNTTGSQHSTIEVPGPGSSTPVEQQDLLQFASDNPPPPKRAATKDRLKESVGLRVVHRPHDERTVDIIFVHGLGGSSRFSWSWRPDPDFFWPQAWLPLEPGLERARILTFGYNAHYMEASSDMFNISSFAKALLMDMKFGSDDDATSLNIGQVPIMFVVHSMGGLVFKKAYIQGYNDPQFHNMLSAISTVVFLATPHDGSGLADHLNNLLAVTFRSSKPYVKDLQKNSVMIIETNDQFRLHTQRMDIISFYEELPSITIPKEIMIVETGSAVIGHLEEVTRPLKANHHTVCKYSSRQDPNYQAVRDIIRAYVHKSEQKVRQRRVEALEQDVTFRKRLVELIDLSDQYSEDLDTLCQLYVPGSCDWILSDAAYEHWSNCSSNGLSVLHITGSPGSGKSVLGSFLVRHFEQSSSAIQYFFFRSDDQAKRSLRNCLLLLAFQISLCLPEYGPRLLTLLEEEKTLSRLSARSIWQKAFVGILAQIKLQKPLTWVIDGIDEGDSAESLLLFLRTMPEGTIPLKVIFLTRPHSIKQSFERLKSAVTNRFYHIDLTTNQDACQLYIARELQFLPQWIQDLGQEVTHSLLERCNGNFLWLRLVMEKLSECDTEADLDSALLDTPSDLVDVYARIRQRITQDLKLQDVQLALAILSWASCAQRQLFKEELSDVLQPQFLLKDVKHTVHRVCCDLVIVDDRDMVMMIHHTAKEFILEDNSSNLAINALTAHKLIFTRCLDVLADPKFRIHLKSRGFCGLLQYTCSFWSYHLSQLDEIDAGQARKLISFFGGPGVLAWIEVLASQGRLETLATSCQHFARYSAQPKQDDKAVSSTKPGGELLASWATEILALVGTFGDRLTKHPSAIHHLIISFCPPKSLLAKQFGRKEPTALQISGLSNSSWEQCSATKFMVEEDSSPRSITCRGQYFAIHVDATCLSLYDSSTFERILKLDNKERILAIGFDKDDSRIVICGPLTVKVWSLSMGDLLHALPNPPGVRGTAASFMGDSRIVICCIDSSLRYYSLTDLDGWVLIKKELKDPDMTNVIEGFPYRASFSPDGAQVAISIRGHPITAWSTDTGQLLGVARRVEERGKSWQDTWCYAQRLTWNSVTGHLVGLYNDGIPFKWYPTDAESEEFRNSNVATEISCSLDGRFILTASKNGSLRVCEFEGFTQLCSISCASPVTDIAMSSDGRRIFDLRESYCNVWQPTVLVSQSAMGEKNLDGDTLAPVLTAGIQDPIVALSCSTNGHTYSFANDAGEVTVSRDETRAHIRLPDTSLGVSCLSWSEDESMLAIGRFDSLVDIKTLDAKGAVLPQTLEIKVGVAIQQLLFASSTTLLVRCTKFASLWSLSTRTKIASEPLELESSHWVLHPHSSDILISIDSSFLSLHDVSNLSTLQRWKLDFRDVERIAPRLILKPEQPPASTTSPRHGEQRVDRILISPDKTLMLVDLYTINYRGKDESCFFTVETSHLTPGPFPYSPPIPLAVKPLPERILERLKIPLGFVFSGYPGRPYQGSMVTSSSSAEPYVLAFLDQDFWLCTWSIHDDTGSSIKKHFFLPQDWINMDNLRLARVTQDGRLLCPRNGEVTVISNGLWQPWLD